MTLFNVMPLGDQVEIDIPGETLTLSKAEYEKVRGGAALPTDHSFSLAIARLNGKSLVSFSNPLALNTGYYQDESDKFVFGLAKAYPKSRFHRDPMSPKTAGMVAALEGRAIDRSDIVAVVAEKSFARIDDGNLIADLEAPNGALKRAGIPVIHYNKAGDATWQGPRQKAVIVITGHSDAELGRFVHALGRDGFLEDNYVVFETCETALTRELMTEIVARYKAAAVWSVEGKNFLTKVKVFVETLVQVLRTQNDSKVNLFQAVKDSAEVAGLNGVWSICHVLKELGQIVADFRSRSNAIPIELSPVDRQSLGDDG